MNVKHIPILTVSYNTPQLLHDLLASVRRFYDNPIHIVDGSDAAHVDEIRAIAAQFAGVHLHVQGYNIHHGPGMSWAFRELPLGPQVLVVDSDVEFLRPGLIETLAGELRPDAYAIGSIEWVNRGGFNVPKGEGAIAYLHPAMMLCNLDVVARWPQPVKHGAPMIEAMAALHDAGQVGLLQHVDWVKNDLAKGTEKHYFDHLWQGTVKKTGGYHLEEWAAKARSDAQAGAEQVELLKFVPAEARRIALISTQAGALTQLLHSGRPGAQCVALGVDASGGLALDRADLADCDCWVFDGTLTHLADPWATLAQISGRLPVGGVVIARIQNAQHWQIQGQMAVGDFRYGAPGTALDRAQLRWFTRVTLFELFQAAGLRVDAGVPRIADEPQRETALQAIRQLAVAMGRDPEGAARDATPREYLVRALALN